MALFVSKYDHCLYDILGRYSAGELPLEIPLIISNHEDLKSVAERFSVPFYHIPFTKDIKDEGEEKQLTLLKKYNVDFIVLARYMQIYGDYHPVLFRLGNAATFCKEFIRLAAVDKCFKTGIPALRRGMKDARKIIKDPNWKPMPPMKATK